MNRFAQFCGIAGVIVLVFGAATAFLMYGEFDRFNFVPAHFILGALLLGFFLLKGGLRIVTETDTLRRRFSWGFGVTLYSVLFLGVLAVINAITLRHELFRYDSTAAKVFTLAPQTIEVVASLPQPVLIRGFYLGGRADKKVEELMNRLTKRFPNKLTFRAVDPERSPGLAERLGINQPGTVHLSFADDDQAGPSSKRREVKLTSDISEQGIVTALLKLSRAGQKSVCYLSGHGEPDLTSNLGDGFVFAREAMEGENLVVVTLKLGEVGNQIPEECVCLVIAAPKRDLPPDEYLAIERFISNGGNALLLHEADGSGDLRRLATGLGIKIGEDVVVQDVGTLLGSRLVAFETTVSKYGKHEIVKDFSEYTSFSLASSVRAVLKAPDSAQLTELAFTPQKTWAETDLKGAFAETPVASPDEAELQGPFSIAVAFEGAVGGNSVSRVVVIGDADFVANSNIRQVFNRDFFLNSLNWIIGEGEGVTIRAGTLQATQRPISPEHFSMMFLFSAILLPELLLLGGIASWWRRRS